MEGKHLRFGAFLVHSIADIDKFDGVLREDGVRGGG